MSIDQRDLLYNYSKYFVSIAFYKEPDPDIQRVLNDIKQLKVDVAYPFLLEIYDDYFNGILENKDLIDILKLIESYVFRRAVCGIPTNSMNKTFASLSREIDKDHYSENLSKYSS
ncbi:MAG: hypothetical protein ACOC0N_09365 [Chroococcales cyanobacterium]